MLRKISTFIGLKLLRFVNFLIKKYDVKDEQILADIERLDKVYKERIEND